MTQAHVQIGRPEPPIAPDNAEGVTAEWLTSAMSRKDPDLVVQAAELLEVIHGASSKLRMKLETNQQGFDKRVMIKVGYEPHSPDMEFMHLNEMHAYRDLAPTLSLETPRCYYADTDANGRNLVIIEDLTLRGVTFLSLLKPIGYELACAFLDGLASMHARWWASPELEAGGAFDWVPDTADMETMYERYRNPETFNHYVTSPRGAAMSTVLHDAARLLKAHAAMREVQAHQPVTVNHGDMHLGNLYTTAEGRPGFLDWQPRKGPWSIDVSYFIIAGVDVVDRRRWEGALLQHYLTRLRAYGVAPPSFEEAWLDYRRSVIWGQCIWMTNGANWQTESSNTAAAARFAQAMVDLDVFGALGV